MVGRPERVGIESNQNVLCMYICIYVNIYICVYVYIVVYIYAYMCEIIKG